MKNFNVVKEFGKFVNIPKIVKKIARGTSDPGYSMDY